MINKVFKKMLVSQIVSAMTVMICMLIDSIMIGRYLGVDAMTAYGLATPVLLIFAAYGSMLSAGIQVMCGKTMGSGSREGTNGCFTVSVVLAAGVTLLGMAAVLIFTDPLCVLLGAQKGTEVFDLTKDYLRGFIVGAPAFIFAQIMVPYMQISGNYTRLVAAVIAMTAGDVTFDILTVNEKFIATKTLGMGLASSLSYYVAFFIGITYFFTKNCMFKFRPKMIEGKRCGELLKYGVPTVINQISLVLLVFLLNKLLLEQGGDLAVASYSVISTVGNICYCFSSGVASVALMLSSIFYCDEDRPALRSLIKTMTGYGLGLILAVVAAVLIAAPALVSLFLTEQAAADMAAKGLRLFSLSLIPCVLNTAFKNFYQGVDRTGFTQAISVMQNFALTALFAFLLSRFWGVDGIWLGYLFGEGFTWLVIVAVVWIRHRGVSFSADAFSMLPKDFGAREGDYMEMTLQNAEDPVQASVKAEEFCLGHGESRRNSSMIALCVEEMTNNIIRHGFTKDKKKHSIDIRLLFKGDKRLLRIRDDCVNFDPVDYVKLHESEDPTSHIGIRMVMKMVKNANYINSLGLNNLTLEM